MFVDKTAYPSVAETPDLSLRQLFAQARVPEGLRLVIAEKGILGVDQFAAIGESLDSFKATVATLLGEEALGEDPSARALSLTYLGTLWKKSSNLAAALDQRRSRLEEDMSRVPEIQVSELAQMRALFVSRHPDVVLVDHKEPHKRFIEKMSRDVLVYGVVPFYELGEIRLRSEDIRTISKFAESADRLLKLSREDERAVVSSESDAMNRLFAWCVALEFGGYCAMSRFSKGGGEITGGTLDYLAELERRRVDFPGLSYLVTADKLIRKKVARLLTDERDSFGSFSLALDEVLKNHRYLWIDARALADSHLPKASSGRRASRSRTPPLRSTALMSPATKGKSSKRKRGSRGSGSSLAPSSTAAEKPVAKQSIGRSSNMDSSKSKRVTDSEWTAIKRVAPRLVNGARPCTFWNVSAGCKFGPECRQKHVCWECGLDHRWIDVHSK